MNALVVTLLLAQERTADRPFTAEAARCGSEIPWTTSLDAAQGRAKETGLPIAWWVPSVQGSPMDRKLVLEKYWLSGPFMMPEVVALMSTRFVPLRLGAVAAHRERFGVAPFEFIEPGLVFLDADLKVLHRAERISTYAEAWFVHLLQGVLRKAGKEEAAARRRVVSDDEAAWRRGAERFREGRDEAGREEWKKIRDGRWAWKAAAELAGDGPFLRGLEVLDPLPADALEGLPSTTTLPRAMADPARAARFLAGMQRASGGWTDSNYNFGGDASLPNVWAAVTALSALALRAWNGPPEAVARAEAFLKDETRIAAGDEQEIAWAHAYRTLYFARTGDRETAARIARKLVDGQKESGIWRHEYDNPFVTATAIHALEAARAAGVEGLDGPLRRGAEALRSTRNGRGVFSYDHPGKGDAIEGGAGRMPFLEYALHLRGLSSKEALDAALELSFLHHGRLERVRKYDDHADAHQNGGFFFWYDQWGRALAATAAGSADALRRQRAIVLATQEIDGCWVDSHELGRVYGTAVALLTLKLCE